MAFVTGPSLLQLTLVLLASPQWAVSEADLSREECATGDCDSDIMSALLVDRRSLNSCKGIFDQCPEGEVFNLNGFCHNDIIYPFQSGDCLNGHEAYSCMWESAVGGGFPCDCKSGSKSTCGCNSGSEPYCGMLCQWNRTYGRSPMARTSSSSEVMYDDITVIAQAADSGNTSNCGWYGCRVAGAGMCTDSWSIFCDSRSYRCQLDSPSPAPMAMVFVHGAAVATGGPPFMDDPLAAMGFYFRRPVGSTQAPGGCVNYGDAVVIAFTDDSNLDPLCGWYGCRVANMDPDSLILRFADGGDEPQSFYLRPPVGSVRSGCVKYGDDVVIAQTADAGNTTNCGWYGCRVARMEEIWPNETNNPVGSMHFGHGGDQPQVFYLRPTPPP